MHEEEREISFFTENPDEAIVLGGLTGLHANAMRRENVAFDPHSSMCGGGGGGGNTVRNRAGEYPQKISPQSPLARNSRISPSASHKVVKRLIESVELSPHTEQRRPG